MSDQPAPGVIADPAAPTKTEVLGNDPTTRAADGTIKDPAAKAADPKAAVELPAGEKKPEAEGKKAEPGVVPDKYDFKPAEGQKLDDKLVAEATPVLRELGITNEQGQKLFDFFNKVSTDRAAEAGKVMETMRTDWRSEVAKSADLGNGTDNLKPEVQANIAKAFSAMDPKVATSMKEAFDLTGAGDNPAIIRGLNALGKLLSEGSLVSGGGPSKLGQSAPGAAPKSAASAMYPNLKTSSAP